MYRMPLHCSPKNLYRWFLAVTTVTANTSSVSTSGASMIVIIADLQRSVCGFVGSCEKEKQ